MPLDAASPLVEVRSVKLSALLDAGLPAIDAGAATDALVMKPDTLAAMHAVAGNVLVDDRFKQWVSTWPAFRTPLEVATFFVGVKYSDLGGASGVLGSTTSAVSVCPDGIGFYRHFQNGSIYWHPSTGAHEVHGEIRAKWAALGWERSFLGYPTSDETVGYDAAGKGRFNTFQFGAIYWYPQMGAQIAHTGVTAVVGQPNTMLAAAPISAMPIDKMPAPIDTRPNIPGKLPPIVIHPIPDPLPPRPAASNAHEVHGAIAAKYRMLGAEASFLGYPTTDETATPDGIGRYNHFQAGSIYWTPNTGANEVHGLIRDYWAAHGWERNPDLGYPISDELVPNRRIGHSRPDSMRKPIASLPVDRLKLPAEAAALGFPRAVVNMPSAPATNATSAIDVVSKPPASSVVIGNVVIGPIVDTTSETPFPGGPLSTAAPEPSRNRFSDFENGVLFWRRGDTAAQPLSPWTTAADGTNMHLRADDVIRAAEPRITQALGGLGDTSLASITFMGTTGYSFDGVGVHNRRHRLMLTFTGMSRVTMFPIPVHVTFEVQVEAAFEPIERIVTAHIVDWHLLSMSGPAGALVNQMRAAMDPLLWSGFKLLQIPDTNAGAPIAVLSVKTMGNGDINIYIES